MSRKNEQAVIAGLRSVAEQFGSGVLAFNDYRPVSRVNRFMGKLLTSRKANSPHNQWGFPGSKDARQPETWNPDLKLMEEASAMHEPEAALFPPALRHASRLATRVPSIARKGRVLQYGFKRPPGVTWCRDRPPTRSRRSWKSWSFAGAPPRGRLVLV